MDTIRLPKLGQAMEEGTVAEWLVDEGEAVSAGDPVVVIETDKLTTELPAEEDGRLLRRVVPGGETVPIGTVLGYVGADESELPDDAATGTGPSAAADDGRRSAEPRAVRASPHARRMARERGVDVTAVGRALGVSQVRADHVEEYLDGRGGAATADDEGGEILGSPLARRVAGERGVSIEAVGEERDTDRVRIADVEAYLDTREATGAEPAEPAGSAVESTAETGTPAVHEDLPIEGARKVMFERMSRVAREYASTTTVARVDVTDLLALRERLAEAWAVHGIEPSITAFVVRAVADALPDYRTLNAELVDEGTVRLYDDVDVGVAVHADDGLYVPTVRDADERPVRDLSAEIDRLAGAVRDGTADYDDLEGGTFTVTNAGSLGAYLNTPQINPPQTAILGVCSAFDQPAVEDGELVEREMLHLTLTYDHRVIEGATAVGFLGDVKGRLESPESLLA